MANLGMSDDRFKLDKVIGSGGYGTVHLADDTLFGGKVAVKLLDPKATADPDYLRDLMNKEARLQASISPIHSPHPNIVYIIHVGSFGNKLGIVMEYVDGGSITDLLLKRKMLPISQVLQIIIQVCEGLTAAHEKNVIHRDIKPNNLLIRRADQVVKIADWGVAKNIELAGPVVTGIVSG